MKDWTLKCYVVFLIVRKNENNSVIIKKIQTEEKNEYSNKNGY